MALPNMGGYKGGGSPLPPIDDPLGIYAKPIEDSALSVAALVLSSHSDLGSISEALGIINVFMLWVFGRFARCDFATIGRNDNPTSRLMEIIAGTTVEPRRALNGFAAEFFAAGLLKKLGMLSVPAKIVTAKEARELPGRWVVKALAVDRRLHFVAGSDVPRIADRDLVLVSELCADAASFDFVRRRILNKPDSFGSGIFGNLYTKTSLVEFDRLVLETLAEVCGKKLESADVLFSEFCPTAGELAAIEREARWDGPQFLRICAARIFIGCGFAHGGNFLVTRNAKLVSIDHTSANFESGEDLRMLFKWTAKNSRAFKILREIAALTESDITAAVEEIPKHPACGDVSPLLPYFTERLRLWKKLAGVGEPVAATASPAV